jgi:hypothetical protein
MIWQSWDAEDVDSADEDEPPSASSVLAGSRTNSAGARSAVPADAARSGRSISQLELADLRRILFGTSTSAVRSFNSEWKMQGLAFVDYPLCSYGLNQPKGALMPARVLCVLTSPPCSCLRRAVWRGRLCASHGMVCVHVWQQLVEEALAANTCRAASCSDICNCGHHMGCSSGRIFAGMCMSSHSPGCTEYCNASRIPLRWNHRATCPV